VTGGNRDLLRVVTAVSTTTRPNIRLAPFSSLSVVSALMSRYKYSLK
jgi:hypothetical protein